MARQTYEEYVAESRQTIRDLEDRSLNAPTAEERAAALEELDRLIEGALGC